MRHGVAVGEYATRDRHRARGLDPIPPSGRTDGEPKGRPARRRRAPLTDAPTLWTGGLVCFEIISVYVWKLSGDMTVT